MNKHIFANIVLLILFLTPVFMTFGKSVPQENPSRPGLFEFQVLDAEPQPLNLANLHKNIVFDQDMVDAGLEGCVTVRVLVDTDGHYVTHEVLHAAHPALAEAVATTLPQLQCDPATHNGTALAAWLTIPFSFKLTGNW